MGLSEAVVRSTRIPLGTGIAGEVAATGKPPRCCRTFASIPVAAPARGGRHQRLRESLRPCVPLEIRGAVQGVMTFNDKRDGRPFDGTDLDFALLIANQAAVVLWSSMLHKQVQDKQEMEQELAIAGAIQGRLLPQGAPQLAGFRFAAAQKMCRSVGGDYYDFIPLADGRLAIAIGDVAGHGLGSALLAADARAALHECLAHGDALEACLEHMNDLLQADTSDEMYMTLLLGVLDPGQPALRVRHGRPPHAGAGASGSRRRLPPVGSNIPLGVRRGIDDLRGAAAARDRRSVFTDGVWEETDAAGRRFGTPWSS